MIAQQKDQELAHCRRLIEEKLGWGSGVNWSNQDFEQLSERFAEETGVTLSTTTLKRVWGRVKYDSAPTTTTLNALAAFIGFENWRHFLNEQQEPEPLEQITITEPIAETTSAPTNAIYPREKHTRQSRWWMGAGLTAALILVLAIFLNYSPKQLSPSDFSFRSRPVAKGIPNSVVFEYDATTAPTDSVFIQQSWDPSRRQLVPKNGHQYTSIYYHPGYYRAKLVVGHQIVREHDVVIPSDGWVTSVDQEPIPVYFNKSQAIANGALQLPLAAIQKENIPLQPKAPMVGFSNVGAIKGLKTDNFIFETRLKNEFKQGSGICQRAGISFVCRNDMFYIPLSAKGCVGQLGLVLGGHEVRSTNADLSAFGRDMSQWVTLRCEVKQKHLKIFIQNKKVYETDMPNAPTDILGISYYFEGTGSVDYTRFTRLNGDIVFEDTFDGVAS